MARLSTSRTGARVPTVYLSGRSGVLQGASPAQSRVRPWMAMTLIMIATVSACTKASTSSTTTRASAGTPSMATVSRSTTESTGPDVPSVSSGSTASSLPSASSGAALVRKCNDAVDDQTIGPDDVTAGPLRYPYAKLLRSAAGLSHFYGGSVPGPDAPGGSTFLKMGTFVKAGATVTVTVAPAARSYLKLEQGSSREGLTSVVFHACPGSSPSSYTRWVGGFQIRGPFPACVALDVQIAGEQTVRHLAIPIGAAGACKT